MNKKITVLGCGTLGAVVIASTVLINLTLSNDNAPKPNHEYKPLDRGGNYEHLVISNQIEKETISNKLLKNNKFDKTLICSNIENIVRNIFKNNNRLKNNADIYKIDINYQISFDFNKLFIDIVWFLENTN
jgi:hypothetical protein